MTEEWEDFKEACEDYKEYLRLWDKTLYGLCKKYPEHDQLDAIFAKVALIGRSYAAGLERHTEGKKRRLDIICNFMLKNGKAIDKEISKLAKLKPFITNENLQTILGSHYKLCKLLAPIMQNRNLPRSFMSKYLHFHAPVVPIYDSIGSSLLKSKDWYPWNRSMSEISNPKKVDPQYWRHCVRLLFLQEDMKQGGYHPTVRELDYYLVWEATD